MAALGICLLAYQFWANLLTIKFYALGYYDWDLDLAAQTMWNLCHGSTFVSLYGTNFLANHAEYFAFLLVPIYFIFQHPLTLIYLKLLSFFGGAFVFYRIAQEYLGYWAAVFLMLFFIIHPANVFMLLFEFHFESLSLGFIFLLFYFYKKERFKPFIITAFLMSLLKENMPPIVAMFGIYALFSQRNRKWLWSLTPLVLGLGLFALEMFVLTPYFRSEFSIVNNIYWGGYSNLGSSPSSIIQSFFFHPGQVIKTIAHEMNLYYVRDLFGPYIFSAFLSPHVLFLGLPIFMQNLLSNTPSLHTIYFHYAATVVPFIFLATVHTLHFIKNRAGQKAFVLFFLFIGITAIFHTINYKNRFVKQLEFLSENRLNPVRWSMIHRVPKNAALISTFSLLDPMSQRKDLYAFFNVWRDVNYFTGRSPYPIPEKVNYALIDFSDQWLAADALSDPKAVPRIRKFLDDGWSVQHAIEDIVLLRKDKTDGLKLVEINNESSPVDGKGIHLGIDHQFELLSFVMEPKSFSNQPLLLVTFNWKADQDVGDWYVMKLTLTKDDRVYYDKNRNIGYCLYPTSVWKKGDVIKEYYAYLLPRLAPGEYTMEIVLLNLNQRRMAKLKLGDNYVANSVIIGKLKI